MKNFTRYFVPCLMAALCTAGAMMYLFFYELTSVYDPGNDHVEVLKLPYVIFAVYISILASLVFGYLLIPFMKVIDAEKEFKKSKLKAQLMDYLQHVIDVNPELKANVGYVKLGVTVDEDIFQARAIGKHRINISRQWIVLASSTVEGLEMVKTTLCHEIAHLYVNTTLSKKEYLAAFLCPFSEKAIRQSWYREFEADYKGRQYFVNAGGNVNDFIKKGVMLLNTPEGSRGSTTLTDHPSWELRIDCIKNNHMPTKALSDKMFTVHKNEIKNKKKK